jgi:CubicO group peptidase (beta-lactamase class C family)
LNNFNQSPLVNVPGTEYSYTTRGYLLLSAAVQKIGGKPFHRQVHREIAQPLGMTTLQPDYQWKNIPNRAVGYKRDEDSSIIRSTDTDVSWKLGGGGFISTIEDIALYAEGLAQHKLVNAETEAMMWTPAETDDGQKTEYGLGFRLTEIAGRDTVGHSGSQEKTKTRLAIHRATGTGVVVMSNTEHVNPTHMAREVFKALETIGH